MNFDFTGVSMSTGYESANSLGLIDNSIVGCDGLRIYAEDLVDPLTDTASLLTLIDLLRFIRAILDFQQLQNTTE